MKKQHYLYCGKSRFVLTTQRNDLGQLVVDLPTDEDSTQTYQPLLSVAFSARETEANILVLKRADGAIREIPFIRSGKQIEVLVDGQTYTFDVLDPLQAVLKEQQQRSGIGDGNIKVAMPGRVIKVLVTEGQTVEAGQGVVVIEAMKMENEFKAPLAGVVRKVNVQVDQVVEAGTLLLQIEPA